jgi:hypothetical protein
LQKLVINTLDPVFEKQGPRPFGRKSLADCKGSVEVLLSVLAMSDRDSGAPPEQVFRKGGEKIDGVKLILRPADTLSFEALNQALDDLAELKPLLKPALLKACAACILADDHVAPVEVELLRAIGAALDCPIPPLS